MNPNHFAVILSQPFTADNIGATARAMKNMGFTQLRLVSPRRNWKRRAYVLARSAANIIDQAQVFTNLNDAVADLNWTFGTTSRISERRGKFVKFDTFIQSAIRKSSKLKIGIVFGRESKGLNNEELDCCDQLVSLPADEAYPSLNLAQAVMVTLFSLSQKRLSRSSKLGSFEDSQKLFLDKAAVQKTMRSFEQALESIGFYDGKDGRLNKIMKITQAIFKRAGMFDYEAQMLKGVSARIIQRVGAANQRQH